MGNVGVTVGLILVLVIFMVLSFRISLYLARRAICKVIGIFRDNDARDYSRALPLTILGLAPRPLFSFRLLRDYKPWALQTLVQSGVVRMAQEGNFYLSEESLEANPNIQSACQNKKIKV